MAAGKLIDRLERQVCYMDYSDSAIFNYAPQQVFDVIAGIEKYPEFLPGWISVGIVERQGNAMKVEQELGFSFLNWRFTSEAIFEPPYHIHIASLEGPLLNLDIDWSLTPVASNKTRVTLSVKFDSAPGPQHRFLHGIFSSSARTLLDYFEQRIMQIYSRAVTEQL